MIKVDKIKDFVKNLQTKIGTDKVAHFGVCYFQTDLFIRGFGFPIVMSALIVMLIAFFKEYVDDVFSMDDLYADLLGIVLYMII